jgi:SAM-dependent methyltransferase
MDKPMSNFHFKLMSLGFAFRDMFSPPKNILAEVGIEPGFVVLDYGCGTGSYSIAAAELVGRSGKVYSLDIHPLAVRRVQEVASKKRLTNTSVWDSGRVKPCIETGSHLLGYRPSHEGRGNDVSGYT